jgi:predicted dehydrogenase
MLKIGVIGAGHLGKIHIRLALELNDVFEFVGFYDADIENAEKVAETFGIKHFSVLEELIDACDCLDIVTPTLSHYDIASQVIRKSKHVFIEKPITQTVEEARGLFVLSEEANVKVQVGHVERFNPAFSEALPHFNSPMFIETHRLAQFNPRGTDVPVVLDLMIHDIDIVLSVVQSPVRRISASGVAVVSDTPDIANARIEFENGCVANLTASRISLKNMRKSRFFQKDAYISVDFLEKELEIVQMEDMQGEAGPFDLVLDLGEGKPSKKIIFDKPEIRSVNAIQEELRTFANAINQDIVPIVSLEQGMNALVVADQIMTKLKLNSNSISQNIL